MEEEKGGMRGGKSSFGCTEFERPVGYYGSNIKWVNGYVSN